MDHATWPLCPLAWLHDAARCLALVQHGRLALANDGRLSGASVSRLAAQVTLAPAHPQPRSESQAPGLSWLFGLLWQGGMIESAEQGLRLSNAAYHWLDMPAHAQIEALRQVWWFAPALNTRWLPPMRRRFPLDGHWRAILFETVRWIVALPTTEWTPAASAGEHLLAQRTLQAAGEGQRLPRVQQAVQEQGRALLRFLLRCALPRLALIEVRGEDAGCLLRPTAEGVAWLQAALAQTRGLQGTGQWAQQRDAEPAATWIEAQVPSQGLYFPLSRARWLAVSADMEVSIHLSAPAAVTFEVVQFARMHRDGAPGALRTRYTITRQTIMAAAARGHPIPDILLTLHRLSQSPKGDVALPQGAISQLQQWHREVIRIQCEPGYRLQVADAALMDALRQRPPFRRRTRAFASRQHAWVSREESKALFGYLRRLGYVPQPVLQAGEQAATLTPALRRALPLPQLLVALRTYAHLRAHLPGLAALDLEQFEREICAALTPEQLAGAGQLVESNAIVVAWAGSESARPAARLDVENGAPEGAPQGTPTPDGPEPPAQDDLGPELPAEQADIPGQVQAALHAGAAVEILYVDARAQVTQRTVRPLRLEAYGGRTCLVAYCELRREERHFRLDRILQVQEVHAGDEPQPLPFPD